MCSIPLSFFTHEDVHIIRVHTEEKFWRSRNWSMLNRNIQNMVLWMACKIFWILQAGKKNTIKLFRMEILLDCWMLLEIFPMILWKVIFLTCFSKSYLNYLIYNAQCSMLNAQCSMLNAQLLNSSMLNYQLLNAL